MSLSRVTVSGTVKKKPEKRFTPSNIPITNIWLEISYVGRGGNGDGLVSQSIRINAWRDNATEAEMLEVGDKIIVSGRLQVNKYTTNDGKKKTDYEIEANSITPLKDLQSIEVSLEEDSQEPGGPSEQTGDLNEMVESTEEIPF